MRGNKPGVAAKFIPPSSFRLLHFLSLNSAQRLADDLQRKGLASRTIGIKLRFADFRTVTRDLSLDEPTDDAQTIRRAAGQCLKRIKLQGRIRLGVRASGLRAAQELEQAGPAMQRQLDWVEGV